MAKAVKKTTKAKAKAKVNPVKKTLKKIGKKPAPPRKAAAKVVTAKKRSVKRAKTASAKKVATKKAAVKSAVVRAVVKTSAAKAPAAKTSAIVKPARAKRPAGVPEQLRDAALKILDERQAEDIVSVDMEGRSSIADYVIVASGRASRQIGAIAHYLREAFEALGVKPVRTEGVSQGDWVLVDGGDVIVHLFRPEVRTYYNIETMWNARPNAK